MVFTHVGSFMKRCPVVSTPSLGVCTCLQQNLSNAFPAIIYCKSECCVSSIFLCIDFRPKTEKQFYHVYFASTCSRYQRSSTVTVNCFNVCLFSHKELHNICRSKMCCKI